MTEQQTATNAYYRFLSGSVNSSKYCVLAICAMIGFTAPALAADPSFEQPGPVDAHRFLPQALLESRQHPVSPEAFNDGFVNTYSVGTSSRVIEVRGTTALLEKCQEMAALDQLRRITDTQAFKSAVKNSAKQTAAAARNLFSHPLSSLRDVPEGAKRFFGRIGDTIRADEGDESQDGKLAGAIGVSDAKRKLAAQLHVDAYTSNETLQSELDRVARAQTLGGLTLSVGSFFVTGPASVALTAVGISQTVEDIVKNSTPEELRRRNRQQLLALGASNEAATDFFDHPDYTPRDETIIATALGAVNVNPELFLKSACQARTRLDALFYRSNALLAAAYRRHRAALHEFRMVEGVLCLLDENGTLIVPLSLDYLQWTESVSKVTDQFTDPNKRGQDIKGILLWTDGQLSARAQTEFAQRQIAVEASVKTADQ
jgi:hypothetical protein